MIFPENPGIVTITCVRSLAVRVREDVSFIDLDLLARLRGTDDTLDEGTRDLVLHLVIVVRARNARQIHPIDQRPPHSVGEERLTRTGSRCR